ncbi:hypothetical protein LINGRAHAP2_LOCUS26449, partial [Linum grandiflorum]
EGPNLQALPLQTQLRPSRLRIPQFPPNQLKYSGGARVLAETSIGNQELLRRNGDEEVLQRDQGVEGEGGPQPCEAHAVARLPEEIRAERIGQLSRQVHPDQLHRPALTCLLRRDGLLLSRRPSRRASPSGAPAARQRARRPLIWFVRFGVDSGVWAKQRRGELMQ